MNYNKASNQYIGKLLLFLVWPFGAFLYSLKSANSRSSYLIYVLFGMLVCWSMFYNNEGAYLDFIFYAHAFYAQESVSFSEMIDNVKDILIGNNPHQKDIYQYVVIWFSRSLSENFHVMFLIASIPFLYFMLKCVKMVTSDKLRFSNTLLCLILLFLFIFQRDIIRVQNFRFATATWVFIYSLLMTYYCDSKKHILLALVTPLIHASFSILCVLLLLYEFVLKRHRYLLRLFFYISIPFAFIENDLFSNLNISFLPSHIVQWVERNFSEESFKSWGFGNNYTGTGFYLVGVFFFLLQRICYILVPILIFRAEKKLKMTQSESCVFYCFVFLFAVVNMIQTLPVLGSRFWSVVAILNTFMLIKFLYRDKSNRNFIYVYIFSFILTIYSSYIPLYLRLLPGDFFYNNAVSLIVRNIGVTNYVSF